MAPTEGINILQNSATDVMVISEDIYHSANAIFQFFPLSEFGDVHGASFFF